MAAAMYVSCSLLSGHYSAFIYDRHKNVGFTAIVLSFSTNRRKGFMSLFYLKKNGPWRTSRYGSTKAM